MAKNIIVLIVFLTAIYFYIKYIENHSVFFPFRTIEATPENINIPFEGVYLETKDNIKLNGWFVPYGDAKYTILFFHGNAGNISHRLEKIKILHDLGLNVFMIDYRGYGRSEGVPSEKGLYLDAESAYAYLTDNLKIRQENIILYGESLGCSVAVYIGAERKVKGIILEGGFSSVRDIARKYYPYIPSFVIADRFNSLSRIQKINIQKLFIHSKNDEIIPFKLAVKLFDLAPRPKELVEITGGHNTAFLDSKEKYISSISSFIKNLSVE